MFINNDRHNKLRIDWRLVKDLVGDLIGVLSIFGTAYLALLIGHGLGLN